MSILRTKNLSIDFGGLRALDHLDLEIHEGEIFGLIGPNGSGKTTCLNLITGFLKPTGGEVIYKGKPIAGLKPYQIAERGIVRTFQLVRLFPNLTCKENIIVGRHLRIKGNMWGAITCSKGYREGEAKLRKETRESLDLVGLGEREGVVAKNLTVGEERKLEIAIALAAKPKVVLLDEPAAGMSPKESTELVSLIRSIQKMGMTVLVVEHNIRVVMDLCHRIAVLHFGVKIAEGTPEEITSNDEVISVYLGGAGVC